MRQVGGFQMLYADSYHSRQEFEAMFDHRGYRAVSSRTFFGPCGKACSQLVRVWCAGAGAVRVRRGLPRRLPEGVQGREALNAVGWRAAVRAPTFPGYLAHNVE